MERERERGEEQEKRKDRGERARDGKKIYIEGRTVNEKSGEGMGRREGGKRTGRAKGEVEKK